MQLKKYQLPKYYKHTEKGLTQSEKNAYEK